MTHFIQQIQAYDEALEINLNTQILNVQIKDAENIGENLHAQVSKLHLLTQSYAILKKDAYALQALQLGALQPTFHAIQALYKVVYKIWQQHKEMLRQEDKFTELLSMIQRYNNEFEQMLTQSWHTLKNRWLESFEVPRAELIKIAHLPGQQAEWSRNYQEQLKNFNTLTKQLPRDDSILIQIQQQVDQLQQIKSKMDIHIPIAVQQFLAQFHNSSFGVSMQSLTPEILQWLQDNAYLNKFVIQRER